MRQPSREAVEEEIIRQLRLRIARAHVADDRLGCERLPGAAPVIGRKAGSGYERLQAASPAAVALRAGPLLVAWPRQRVVTPLARNPMPPNKGAALNRDAGARPRAQDDRPDHRSSSSGPVHGFGDG